LAHPYAGEKKKVNGKFIKINSMAIPSSVGFQMLEGLQTGQNLTWRLLYKTYPIHGYQLKLPRPKSELSKLFILETSN
jgi:hypothetical protein